MSQFDVRQQVDTVVNRMNPLQESVKWWVLVAEGVVALILGLFILVQRQQAAASLVQLVGIYLLVTSAIVGLRLMTGKGEPTIAPWRRMRIGIGLLAGIVAVAHPWIGLIGTGLAAIILAIGLLFVGLVGLYANLTTSQLVGWRWDQVLINAIFVLLGGMVVYHNFSGSQFWLLPLLGWIATIGGMVLCGLGARLYYQQLEMAAATPAFNTDTPRPSPSTAPTSESLGSTPTPGSDVTEEAAIDPPVHNSNTPSSQN